MSTYKDLLQQRDSLEKQISEARSREFSDAVSRARAIVGEYDLAPQDIFPALRLRNAGAPKSKVAAKYRDPATGSTWTGRGKAPRWIQDQDRAHFEIK